MTVSAERPIVVLSGNSSRHALLSLAAMHIGVPVCPVSTGWSLLAEDHRKLRDALALLTPGLVYVEDLEAYGRAVERDARRPRRPGRLPRTVPAATSWTSPSSSGTRTSAAVRNAFDRIGHDTVAKLLFTSGSVGVPKAVITTQRMLVSNMAAKGLLWSFVTEEPPVFLDWLPWSHTFAGNQNLDMVLRFGGTMYLDTGRPTAELFEETVRNIRAVSPTIYSTVPRVYEFLVPRLREDPELRAAFFRRLRLMHYAGSTLPDHLFAEIRAIARQSTGRNIPLVSSWGSTETAPMATDCHFEVEHAGNIGVPIPGTVLKLVPSSGSLEVRVRGPNVTPGYWRSPETTAAAFDEEGYYRIGDAVAFVDGEHPEAGLRFDGRLLGGLQALDRDLGPGWRDEGPRDRRALADRLGCRRCRRRPRFARPARLPGSGRLPPSRRHATRDTVARRRRAPGRPAPRRGGHAQHVRRRRLIHVPDSLPAARRPALSGRRGDHRQGLHQPARGAHPPSGPGRAALRGTPACVRRLTRTEDRIVTNPLVELDVADQIATITLARPDKRNAISDALLADLDAALDAVPEGTRAIVLAGRGEHFCAGLDLSALEALTPRQVLAHSQSWQRVFSRIELGGIPVIAALHGGVIGGGLELAAATHIRVAEPDTFFQLPEGRHGIFVGGGGSVRVARIIGSGRMCEMMLTNRRVDVEDGYAIGLVHYRVAAGEALATARRLAENGRRERTDQQPGHHDGPPTDRQHGQR